MFAALLDAQAPPAEPHFLFEEQRFAVAALERLAPFLRRKQGSLTCLIAPEGAGKSHLTRDLQRSLLQQKLVRKTARLDAAELAAALLFAEEQRLNRELMVVLHQPQLLICENLQDLHRDPDAQAILANLCDHLLERGTQLIMTSRQFPGRFSLAHQRLVSRLHGGLIAKLVPLQVDSRLQVLTAWASWWELEIAPSVLQQLAEKTTLSLTAAQAALNDLRERKGSQKLQQRQRNLAHHLNLASDPIESPVPLILKAVAEEFSLSIEGLQSRSREQNLVIARQCVMYAARVLAGLPLEHIGTFLGSRLHTTVTRGCRQFETRLSRSPVLREHFRRIQQRLDEQQADWKHCG